MVCHFETTTEAGDVVNVTLADNTVILRFPIDGEEQEWCKTERRMLDLTRPALDEQFDGAVIEAVTREYGDDDDTRQGVDITLTNANGETVNFEAAWYPDEEWGRIYGPLYGKAPAAPVVA